MSASTTTAAVTTTPDWFDLLEQAVNEPAELQKAHASFKHYSLANKWLASTQLRKQGRPIQPINTFKGWLSLNRAVQKGEKASIALVMPVPVKYKAKDETGEETEQVKFTRFMLRRQWFALEQTQGETLEAGPAPSADWDVHAALAQFEVTEVPYVYRHINDTEVLVYSSGLNMAVSELCAEPPAIVRVRELSRIVMGHTGAVAVKGVPEEEAVMAVEAEAATYLVAATLDLGGLEVSRARLQEQLSCIGKDRVPEKCINRAFSTADKIINAGYC